MKTVKKKWGSELWIENNDKYCGKILTIKRDYWSSGGLFHYHEKKDETFYVLDGELHLDVGLVDGSVVENILGPGEKIRLYPGSTHRFTSNTPVTRFIEFSTEHDDNDSIRCRWDEKLNRWFNVIVPAYFEQQDHKKITEDKIGLLQGSGLYSKYQVGDIPYAFMEYERQDNEVANLNLKMVTDRELEQFAKDYEFMHMSRVFPVVKKI